MARLVVIGIDGMDPCVFEKIQASMPHLSSILQSGGFKRCRSVFPPDSIPSWVTIFTGEYPAQHGWLDNIDYEDIRKGEAVSQLCNLQGRTFWDRVGNAGKRVCIINPLLAYPVWPVNGIMASGPVFITGEKQIFPNELTAKYRLPELGGMTEFPREGELKAFVEATLERTRDLAEFGLKMLESEPWDLFFISFFSLDRIQHFLWRFWDPADPLYPGSTDLEDAITRSYKTFDEIVGKYMDRLDANTGLIVLSDHGHGQRPTMLLNVNELLREAGILRIAEESNKVIPLRKGVELAKNTAIKLVVKGLGEGWLYRVARLLPKKTRKALKKSSYLIDKQASTAWASDLGGGAAAGGIIVNPGIATASQEYRAATGRILEKLESMNEIPHSRIIEWAEIREEASCYPDVVFELDPQFSVGRSLFCPVVEKSPRHRIISGGHKKEGVLFAQNMRDLPAKVNSIRDIYRLIVSFVLSNSS